MKEIDTSKIIRLADHLKELPKQKTHASETEEDFMAMWIESVGIAFLSMAAMIEVQRVQIEKMQKKIEFLEKKII